MNKDTATPKAVTDAGDTNGAHKGLQASGKALVHSENPHPSWLGQTETVSPNSDEVCSENLRRIKGKGQAEKSGVNSKRASISKVRKAVNRVIETLCRKFDVGHLEEEIHDIFQHQKGYPLTTVAAAFFIYVYRLREQPISLQQILPLLDVTPQVDLFSLGAALKRVERYQKEKLPATPQITTESTTTEGAGGTRSIPEVHQHARRILPNLTVQDPFIPSVEITNRVYDMTDNIVRIFERRTKHSFVRRIVTIAAGFLAWQSCHYYDKNYNTQVPFATELREPKEEEDFQEYLTLTKLDIDDVTAGRIIKSITLISMELLQLFERMPQIFRLTRKGIADMPRYLERILKFADATIDDLNQEEETERLNEPIIAPVIPRELTVEEEAVLDVPELNEKDMPLSKYLLPELELDPINILENSGAAAMLATSAGPSKAEEFAVYTQHANRAKTKRAPTQPKIVLKSERGGGGQVEQTPEFAKVDP